MPKNEETKDKEWKDSTLVGRNQSLPTSLFALQNIYRSKSWI